MNEQIIIHLDNSTEEEREQFTKLLGKASEEPSKESRVWKPKKIDQYYYINDFMYVQILGKKPVLIIKDLKLGMYIKRERKCALH